MEQEYAQKLHQAGVDMATRAALVETYPATSKILGHARVARRLARLFESDFEEAREFADKVRAEFRSMILHRRAA